MASGIILANRIIDLRLTGSEFHLIAALAAFGERSFSISINRMSDMTGMSVPTIKRILPLLEGRGLLRRYSKIKDHLKTVNRYRLNLPKTDRKRFFVLPHEAVRELPSSVLLVYAYLLCRSSGRTKKAYPSERQIAKDLNMSRTTVRSCTVRLEIEGWLKKERRFYEKIRKTAACRSFAYSFDAKAQKSHPQIRRGRRKREVSGTTSLPFLFLRYKSNFGVLRKSAHLRAKKEIFRPPRPPCLASRKRKRRFF